MGFSLRERRHQHQLHRGFPMPRLLTMFIMLVIMGMIFTRLRDPSTFRFFASSGDRETVGDTMANASGAGALVSRNSAEASKTSAEPPKVGAGPTSEPPKGSAADAKGSAAAVAAPADLTPTGPTDQDPDEMEEIKPSLSVIYDGSLQTMPAEQPAYFQILGWVDHQPLKLLEKRAVRDFFYDTLTRSPDDMRLQIVDVLLTIKQVARVFKTTKDGKLEPVLSPEGKPLYEVRGVSEESGTNLYFGMVTDLPPEMPIRTDGSLNEDARLVGYFFKVQGYISKLQQLQAEETGKKMKPLKAPLIIGRLVWLPAPGATAATRTPVWVIAPIGGVAIIVVVAWVYWNSRRRTTVPRIAITRSGDPDAPSVDSWLDQAQSGQTDFEAESESDSEAAEFDSTFKNRFSGNIFDDPGESKHGQSSVNGHAGGNHLKNGHGDGGAESEVRENDNPN